MPYDNISSRSNTESGTLTDGTSTATFTEIENYVLGSGDDKVIGSTEADNVSTGTGADTVDGGEGDDTFDLAAQMVCVMKLSLKTGMVTTRSQVSKAQPIGGGNYSAQDQLNVGGLNDNDGNPVDTGDVTITVDGNGHQRLLSQMAPLSRLKANRTFNRPKRSRNPKLACGLGHSHDA